MVGCDEGKATASARCGGRQGGCVPDCESPPPAGTGDQRAARSRPPLSGRRDRLADVGEHVLSAGADRPAGLPAGPVSTSSAEGVCRSRSWPRRASRLRLRAVKRPLAKRLENKLLTNGTNRELDSVGVTVRVMGAEARRPALTDSAVLNKRRPADVRGGARRRRGAQPHRSGGRRGWGDGRCEQSCLAPALVGTLTRGGGQLLTDDHTDTRFLLRGERQSIGLLRRRYALPGVAHGRASCTTISPGSRTRTSCRSGRRVETGRAPLLSLAILMARSVGHSITPRSSSLARPRDWMPRRAASWLRVHPCDFLNVAASMSRHRSDIRNSESSPHVPLFGADSEGAASHNAE